MPEDTSWQDVPIRSSMIRLGQLLKFADIAESGAEAGAMISGGDVQVNGERETRRGRQLAVGDIVAVEGPAGAITLRVTAD